MKSKVLTIILALVLATSLVACGSGESTSTASSSTASASTTASRATATVEKEEKEEEKIEVDSKFGNRLDAYQGIWEKKRIDLEDLMDDWLLVVGEDIYWLDQVRISTEDKMNEVIIQYTFDVDDDNKLVCFSQYDRWEQTPISLDDDGNIEFENSVYEKVSDEQIIPTEWEPEVGMTELQVQLSIWGKPSEINRTTTADSVSEEWVYGFGTIYLTDGVVTSIEEKGIK